ncbi:helix-turn-helix domain-containing protein [Chitinophaga alhagiae]|uniref:helix-turn-helix domain-containing protein n=1 Tax=Chitinophaga alhagiae TaxID=2203219 RepID=UPI000E5C3B53|nr:helix-turn-helix domain-containing protein [Chitinophaga alhagiae]
MKKTIKNKQEYFLAMAAMEPLLAKGFDKLSPEEEKKLDQLTDAVEEWETKEYPLPVNPDFVAILEHLMQTRGYNQTELSHELDISKSQLSGILGRSKYPNVDLLVNLHQRFRIDGNILLQSLSPR